LVGEPNPVHPHVSRRWCTRPARPDGGAPAWRPPPVHGSPIPLPSSYLHRRRHSVAASNHARTMGAAPAWAASACRRGEARSRAADEEESAALDHARPVRALLRSLALCRMASFVMPPWQEPGARVLRRPERASDLRRGKQATEETEGGCSCPPRRPPPCLARVGWIAVVRSVPHRARRSLRTPMRTCLRWT